jgi:hypothetical protein
MKTKPTKSVKKSTTGRTANKKEPVNKKYEPSEEEIRELAEIIFHQRIDRGEFGTAEEDWLKAEEYLSYQEV